MVIFNLSLLKAAYSSIRPSLIPGEESRGRGYRELYNVLIALHDHREPRTATSLQIFARSAMAKINRAISPIVQTSGRDRHFRGEKESSR